jgi:colanic acid/amylovoran biosynthesis glycosyltransferase
LGGRFYLPRPKIKFKRAWESFFFFMLEKHPVILFNSHLLPPSQTFIRSLAEELQQFTPYYMGCRRVDGLELPADRVCVINPGNTVQIINEILFKFSGFSPKLYKYVHRTKPELIHAQFGLSGALVLPLARALKIPLIVHFRGADATVSEAYARYSSLNHWIYFRRREALKRETQLFITVSKFIKNKILEQGFPAERIITHYHGVDVKKFKPDPEILRKSIVLFVGRLTEKKGCEYLIDAMAQVQAQKPDIELILIGDGPLKTNLEAMAAKSLKRFQFLGVQSATVVRAWMNCASLLIAPSVTAAQGDSEGLPNVVLEAQAMGLPVVSTIHAGIPEAVIHGETGFLSPERDSQSLAHFSLRLFQDADLWQSFSLKGQKHMYHNFNREIQTKSLEEIYTGVIRGEI